VRIPLAQFDLAAFEAATASRTAASTPLANLVPGTTIAARVLALLENGQVQLAVGNAVIEATTELPLTLGATVQLAVQNAGNNVTLQFVGELPANAATAGAGAASAPAPSAQGAASAAAGDAAAPVGAAGATAASGAAASQGASAAVTSQPSPSSPPPAAQPAIALTEAVRSAAVTQNSLAPLYAELAAAVNVATLPEPVLRAAMRVLSLRPQLDENLGVEDVKQAFMNSGLFLESDLARNQSTQDAVPAAASEADAASSAATPSAATVAADVADLKAALTVFRNVVAMTVAAEDPSTSPATATATRANALVMQETVATEVGFADNAASPDNTAPAAASATPSNSAGAVPSDSAPRALPALPTAPPPPFRGSALSAQPSAVASIDGATPPHQAARILMAATDAALSRQTLLQAASLPGQAPGAMAPRGDDGPRWNFEVPFATPQGTQIAQFEISRDGRSARPVDGVAPVWRARFSIDLAPLGPVHAQISLRGARAAVTLWAEQADGAARLRAGAGQLAEALRAAELDAGDLVVRDGTPRQPAAAAAPAGHFLDRAS
jgi:hypothetical protein